MATQPSTPPLDHSYCTLYCEHGRVGCAASRTYLAAHPDDPDVRVQLAAAHRRECEACIERGGLCAIHDAEAIEIEEARQGAYERAHGDSPRGW